MGHYIFFPSGYIHTVGQTKCKRFKYNQNLAVLGYEKPAFDFKTETLN